MTAEQLQISLILLAALVMFAWNRWRYDLVAMFSLLVSVLLGLVPQSEAFVGFAHPAVVTVAAVLILSQGLTNAGVVAVIADWMRDTSFSPLAVLASLTAIVTVLSAFMNNVGALALMLPITMTAAAQYQIPPARLLMPLAFGSLLGGLTTLIGTPPNIIIGAYREQVSGESFSMFSFSPVGVPIAIIGVLFIVLLGWRFIPKARMSKNASTQLFEINTYLTEISVREQCDCIGMRLQDLPLFEIGAIELLGVATERTYARPVSQDHIIAAGDIFIVRADPNEIKPLLDNYDFELLTTATHIFEEPDQHASLMLEGVISQDSPLVNRDTRFLRRLSGRSVALVGLARQGVPVVRRLRRQIFRTGDVLLLLGHEDTIDEQFKHLGLWPLARRPIGLDRKRKIGIALLAFVVAIVLAMTNLVSLPIAFILGVMVYVLTGIIRVREIYEEIDWAVIVLLAAMIPVGMAMESTKTTELFAQSMLSIIGVESPVIVITCLLVATMLLSSVINNAATALVMAPIGVATADGMGVHSDPFLMAIAIGASCAFLTPFGHQSNTLVMGPGGYQFGDYWRVGLPLEIVITVVSVPLILWIWPL